MALNITFLTLPFIFSTWNMLSTLSFCLPYILPFEGQWLLYLPLSRNLNFSYIWRYAYRRASWYIYVIRTNKVHFSFSLNLFQYSSSTCFVIRSYSTVYTAYGIFSMINTICCMYSKIPPYDEQLILVNNQLDAQLFFMYVYFYSLHVSGSHVPIIRRINCIDTTSGVCHSV